MKSFGLYFGRCKVCIAISPILWNWDTADVNLPCATFVFLAGIVQEHSTQKV
jgi:hypothetical protein